MRLERLMNNKIKIFLTSDDLSERGLSKEDIWKDSLKWRQLFHEMLEEASKELGIDFQGSITVEIFSLQAQGMIMIVTLQEVNDEKELLDGFIDMEVTVEGNDDILFEFESIEHLIQLAHRLFPLNIIGGTLFSLNGRFYLYFDNHTINDLEKTISLLAEYGDPSIISIHRMKEYGKEIITNKTIQTLVHYIKDSI
ncbi:genetic competence negative regulator [Bacillus aquiflavi]|uniref:genetic competence negative regulator n=1 Tax=Bacillus aquiflavi TaxID=2672567 RepID=UPI001CA80D19|nr:genetic competence negative regulator [Bacillus aquiflavi]UAC47098.1 genetic competence negative regulator [Bacillus aquiflavi]